MASRGSRGRRARSAASARDIELRSVEEEEQFRRELEKVSFHITSDFHFQFRLAARRAR